jgi:hypothetical protein
MGSSRTNRLVSSTNIKIGELSSGIGMELHERFAGKGLR